MTITPILLSRLTLELRHLSTRRSRLMVCMVLCISWAAAALFGLNWMPWLILLPLLLISLATDLMHRIIPNWLTGASLVTAMGTAWQNGYSAGYMATEGFLVLFIAGFLVYLYHGMGGGDVKLFACLGALLGVGPAVSVMVWSFLLAAAPVLLRLVIPRMLRLCYPLTSRRTGSVIWASALQCDLTFEQLQKRQPMAAWIVVGVILSLNGATLI